jgi:hypothetical protein
MYIVYTIYISMLLPHCFYYCFIGFIFVFVSDASAKLTVILDDRSLMYSRFRCAVFSFPISISVILTAVFRRSESL